MDKKENYILEKLKVKIENSSFDEIDIMLLLILVRRFLKGKYENILEFSDLIAHRERNTGITMKAIKNAIDNNYSYDINNKSIKGYSGIKKEQWKSEWERFGREYGIKIDNQRIKEITLCIYSLVNQTEYRCNDYYGIAKIDLIPKSGQIALVTTENKNTSLYICFAEYDGYAVNEICDNYINYDFVCTRRTKKGLELINDKNEVLVIS